MYAANVNKTKCIWQFLFNSLYVTFAVNVIQLEFMLTVQCICTDNSTPTIICWKWILRTSLIFVTV